ncbi:hypothetical protein BDW75DRAFT_198060 [Aspergillus navahoensis]
MLHFPHPYFPPGDLILRVLTLLVYVSLLPMDHFGTGREAGVIMTDHQAASRGRSLGTPARKRRLYYPPSKHSAVLSAGMGSPS